MRCPASWWLIITLPTQIAVFEYHSLKHNIVPTLQPYPAHFPDDVMLSVYRRSKRWKMESTLKRRRQRKPMHFAVWTSTDSRQALRKISLSDLHPFLEPIWVQYLVHGCISIDVKGSKIPGKPNFLNIGQDVDIQCTNKRIRWESSEIGGVCRRDQPQDSAPARSLKGKAAAASDAKALVCEGFIKLLRIIGKRHQKNHVKSCYPLLQRRDLT